MHILFPETDNCPFWISRREKMTVENISWSIFKKECCPPGRDQTHNHLITNQMCIQLSHLASLCVLFTLNIRIPQPLKCQENLHLKMSSVYVLCWIFLQTFQTYFCIQANNVNPDQTAPKSVSTLFTKMTLKITSRWQSRRQLLWLAVLSVNALPQLY